MKILAIETTIPVGSLAFFSDGILLRHSPLPTAQRSAAVLAPQLQQALREIGWSPRDVQLVAVSIGPGSFTGVRIGLVTAKLFAYAVGARLIGVDSLDVVAQGVPDSYSPLVVLADAQRGEVTAKVFTWEANNGWRAGKPSGLVRPQEWLASLALGQPFWLAGPGLYKHRELLGNQYRLVPEHLWNPSAVGVGKLAWQRFLEGQTDDVWTLKPIYYRPSYAEEKRLKD